TYPRFYQSNKAKISGHEFVFHEGNVYDITNFALVEDKSAFKITKSIHKLIFYKQTKTHEKVDDEYPRLMFEFKQFSELTVPETIDSCTPFDIIVRIVLTYPRFYQSNKAKISGHEFVFHDVKGQRIDGWAPGCLSQKFKEFNLLEGNVASVYTAGHPDAYRKSLKNLNILKAMCTTSQILHLWKTKVHSRLTKSSHKLIFYKQTKKHVIDDDENPRLMFEFKQFSKLTVPETIDPCTPFDIIGRISNKAKISGHDFVFHDVKGQRIHGWAPGCLSQNFKEFKLFEGNVYDIKNFALVEDKSAFKITKSSHKLIFYKQTKMHEIVDDEYPRLMFEFKQFSELTVSETIGQRIHDWAPRCLSQKFKEFKLLEGNVYDITNFALVEDKSAFKITKSSHKLIFYKQTKKHVIVDDENPRLMFEFKQFSELTVPETIDPCTP
ncbi:nucleic acid-binding, partial [Striga asiatica]